MKKSERAFIIKRILDKKYPKTPIPLDHFDNYSLLIAVLLSAQCTDERVNQITPILFSKASTPFEMSKLSEKQIYNIIKPCGLGPKKSKAIKKLSKIFLSVTNFLLHFSYIFCCPKFPTNVLKKLNNSLEGWASGLRL